MAHLRTDHSDQPARAPSEPRVSELVPGRVYRASEFDRNTLRRLVAAGRLVDLGEDYQRQKLFACLRKSPFGEVPPSESEMLRAYFGSSPFVVTGAERWNALGLGSTGVFAKALVYNEHRSGTLRLGKRTFVLRQVAQVPENPPREWFAVDLLDNASAVGASAAELAVVLRRKLERGLFDGSKLRQFAFNASPATQKLVDSVVSETPNAMA